MALHNDDHSDSPLKPDGDHQTDEQQTLLFESSPYGNLDAMVQHDDHSVYFYLNGPSPFGTRACWVRNLETGPYILDTEAMKRGQTPMMPRTHCTTPLALPLPDPETLNVIWLEEGNDAALLENNQAIAFIPPWSGVDGFHGYAAACSAENELCWPMPPTAQLHQRLARSAEFWLSFQDETENLFQQLQRQLLHLFNERFGTETPGNYFSIDGGEFPPRGLSLYAGDQGIVGTTIGMSLCPQPNVELNAETPAAFRRVELGLQFKTARNLEAFEPAWQALGGLAAYPWQRLTWLGSGHTVPFNAFAELLGNEYRYALLVSDQQQPQPVDLPPFRGDPTNLLWLVPITETQREQLASGDLAISDINTNACIEA